MAKCIPKLDSGTFRNWLKLGIGLHYTKQGIEELVTEDAEQFQKEILEEIYKQGSVRKETICTGCCTANVLYCPTRNFCNRNKKSCTIHSLPGKQSRTCPKKICNNFVKKICSEHRHSVPSWKNTDAERWCTDAVELAKCFMPRDGYTDAATFQQVDFNGVVNVIINNKRHELAFTEDLSKPENVACKAREVGRTFRHSSELAIEDAEFTMSMDILLDLLTSVKDYQHKREIKNAMDMLNQLKTQSLNVSSSDAIEVIHDFLDEKSRKLSETADEKTRDIAAMAESQKREINMSHVSFLREVANAAKAVDELTTDNLEKVMLTKDCAVSEIQKLGRKERKAISKAGLELKRKASKHIINESKRMRMSIQEEKDKAVADLRSSASTSGLYRVPGKRISESEDYPKLKQNLREDLNRFCRKQHTNLPVSPVRIENKVPLLEFYVAPSLRRKEYEKGPYVKQDAEQTTTITTFHDVFFNGATECQDIYLASPAGTGKTSYLKRMALAWCFSHSSDEEQRSYFTEEELNTMKEFEFLFLLSLRETSQVDCHVDNMILTQVIHQLSLSYLYSDDFIQEVLHHEKCLILIDGLDEWTHPDRACFSATSVVPNRKVRKKCTILTTTRPWKLDTVIESKDFIDQHIEMSGLEDESANALIGNALRYLNHNYQDNKLSDDFNELMRQNRVHKLKSIPLLLLQMLCLWFSRGRLGNSRCEIYSNMLEFLFSHAMRRISHPETRSKTRSKMRKKHPSTESAPVLPTCFSDCQLCRKHKNLLLALGKLAFDGLFGTSPESSILFRKSVVENYLNKSMLFLCKEIGILSQNNACRKLAQTESNFSFIHKSYQEYLAALYISLKWSQDTMDRLVSFCNSTENILQVSNVFVFVSGMNQDLSDELSRKVSEIVSNDEGTTWFRRNIGTLFIKSRVRMHRLHTMMMNCVIESYDNGFNKISVIAQDIIINSKCKLDWLLEKRLIDRNMKNIKSLDIQADGVQEQVHRMLHSLDVQSLTGLEKLFVWGSLPTQDITIAIQNSLRSVVCLELWHLTFTNDLLCAIQNLGQLEALSLLSVTMSHDQIEALMAYLKKTTHLRQLSLNEVKCLDHGYYCSGYILNLLKNNNLTMLLLDKLHVTEIKVNSKLLVMCVVEWMHIGGATAHLLNALKHAPNLERFECDGIDNSHDLDELNNNLPTLAALKYVRLRNIKLGDRYLDLSKCESLECIYMWRVEVSAHTLEKLLDIIKTLQRTVIVMLEGCEIKPAEEYLNIRQHVETSTDFEVTRDTNVSNKYHEFYFRTTGKSQ